MKKLKKTISAILASVMLLSLAACGNAATTTETSAGSASEAATEAVSTAAESEGSQTAGEVVTLEVWHYFEAQDGDRFKEFCEQYDAEHEDVVINVTYVSRPDLLKQYTMGVVSGELPDVGMVDNPDHASFSAMGVFEDITDLVDSSDLENYFEGPLASCMYEGRLYGLPQNSNCLALFINNQMFADAGVAVPTTWDEMTAAAEKLTDPATGVYGMVMSAKNNEEGTFQYLPFLLSSGATLDNLGSEDAVRSLQMLTNLVEKGYMSQDIINWGQGDALTQFTNGKAAMMLNGPWNVPTLAQESPDLDYSVVLVPKDKEYSSVLGGENFAVCKGASMEASVDFLSWLCSKQVDADFAEVAGKFPTRSDSILLKDIWTTDPIYSVFAQEMEYAMPRGPHPRWPEISTLLSTALTEALTGEKTPQDALTAAADKYSQIK